MPTYFLFHGSHSSCPSLCTFLFTTKFLPIIPLAYHLHTFPIYSSPVPGKGSPPLLSSAPYTDSITVMLVAPEYPNGVITQYNIRWYREGQEDSAQMVTVPGTQQSYTLSGLTPGTYFVQVRVSNEINYREMYNHITAYKNGTYFVQVSMRKCSLSRTFQQVHLELGI